MDNILLNIGFILAGVLMLYYGAEALVKGSSNIALYMGIAPMIVGLTVVAFGTSAPELFVSFSAGMQNSSDIALGNVIGSNICNIGLILGLSALIMPVNVNLKQVKWDLIIMLLVSFVVSIMVIDGELGRIDGLILVAGMAMYMFYSIRKAVKGKISLDNSSSDNSDSKTKKSNLFNIFLVILGLAILILGSNLFIEGAIQIAKSLGISNAIIGLTLVAVGTSLPELATSILAAVRKQADISLGNIVGSNIFNIMFILGLTALFFPINAGGVTFIDYSVMILLALLVIPMGMIGKKFSRIDGTIFLVLYVGYIYWLYLSLPK